MSGHNLASQMFFQDMTKLCNSITNFKRHLLSTHHGTCTPPKVLWLGFSNCDHNSIWSHKKSSKVINVKTKKIPNYYLVKQLFKIVWFTFVWIWPWSTVIGSTKAVELKSECVGRREGMSHSWLVWKTTHLVL